SQTTVWDGVYSETQARRGEQVFKTECSYCHKEDLSGGFFDDGLGRAPALAGRRAFDSSFLDRWGGMTLADLVSTIAATMPQKRPASLSLENYVDVASYVLSKNEVPAGATDLPGDVDALTRIGIVARTSAKATPQPAAVPAYTDEQSTRGEALYTKACAPCHDDKSLAALFDKILTTMPLQDPGSLNQQQSIDLVAYILKLNHFSPGQEALPTDAAALGAMRLTPR